jgi:hypothetical protein
MQSSPKTKLVISIRQRHRVLFDAKPRGIDLCRTVSAGASMDARFNAKKDPRQMGSAEGQGFRNQWRS